MGGRDYFNEHRPETKIMLLHQVCLHAFSWMLIQWLETCLIFANAGTSYETFLPNSLTLCAQSVSSCS